MQSSAGKTQKTLGLQIKRLRESQHLTQEKVAEAAGITPEQLSRVENGRVGVSEETLKRLADVLGTSVDAFEHNLHAGPFSLANFPSSLNGPLVVVVGDRREENIK